MYAPALEAVRNTGHIQRFDAIFATPSAFKCTPNPNIDAAWVNITSKKMLFTLPWSHTGSLLIAAGCAINISEGMLHAVNTSAKFSVELAPEIGGGYMTSVEALQQLYCMNMLRQATYKDY